MKLLQLPCLKRAVQLASSGENGLAFSKTVQIKDSRQVPKKGSGTVASLELIRGLASLDVFIWHMLNASVGFPHIPGFYWLMGFSRESVIVFFVLSGYVIALSQQRLHRDAGQFMKARVKRILPIYLVSLAVAYVVGALIDKPITLWQIVGHLLFLQSYEGSFVPTLSTDGPLWSLGTEFEFYALLGLFLYVKKPVLLQVWWWIAIAGMLTRYLGHFGSGAEALLLEFLALSPCWLLGYFAAGLGSARSLSLLHALTLFAMIPLVSGADFGAAFNPKYGYDGLKCFFLALLIVPLIHTLAVRHSYPEAKPFRQGWLAVLFVYLCLASYALSHSFFSFSTMALLATVPPVIFALGYFLLPAGTVWPFDTARFRSIAIFMGGSSYALYVIHTPMIFIVENFVSIGNLQLPVLLALVTVSVLILEFVVQPFAASWIDRIWKSPQRAKEVTA